MSRSQPWAVWAQSLWTLWEVLRPCLPSTGGGSGGGHLSSNSHTARLGSIDSALRWELVCVYLCVFIYVCVSVCLRCIHVFACLHGYVCLCFVISRIITKSLYVEVPNHSPSECHVFGDRVIACGIC